ncbi:MAG: sugar ABC transporter permease [Tetrasphaera jenkinsii]|uniref:Alpha-glucoside transport system permease protein aglF n=1 Tax=Nostocoides jenkinsii Ben 74 TaxID=1193518 RepID=A0A077M981_9MICO|nr:sugar ABC transporter permease [Tetrasphaera jenkinsii]MCI1262786.1 sugar ABC transporter permease [Tetrasphaera jenkinsii]CCI53219.1 Alpha-glucoside transport system permease protein aglF [Tetrasphaera jenkinsii Ben 74]
MAIKILNALIAIVGGIGGAMLLFWILNKLSESLKGKWEDRVKPWAFAGPAILAIAVYLIYPALVTLQLSFANAKSTKYVGLKNYTDLLSESEFRQVLLNNLLWIILVPASVVVLGLGVAVLADRLRPTGEKITKTLIFLPMAISMVGAATIWRAVYDYQPVGTAQTGLLNGIRAWFGKDPTSWYQLDKLHFNSLLLMIILIWTQVGYSMVLLSAAIKSVPEDTIEAGRIDGAGERKIFFSIIVPQIWGTVITVFITVLIGVMKVFDVVYVATNGQFNTDVVGRRFYYEMFTNGNNGYAAAIVVLLMIAITPVLIYQVRHFKREEANR